MGKSYKRYQEHDDDENELHFEKEDKRLKRALRTKDIDIFYCPLCGTQYVSMSKVIKMNVMRKEK